jgi:hypothetical protein
VCIQGACTSGTGAPAVNTGTWNHVAVSWKSNTGNANIFLNGQLKKTEIISRGTSFAPGGTIILGNRQSAPGVVGLPVTGFIGQMSKITLWKKCLTSAEILSFVSTSMMGTEDGVVLNFAMKQSETVSLQDTSSTVSIYIYIVCVYT